MVNKMILANTIFDSQLFCLLLWAGIFIVALVVELSTEQLVSVWFCGGAAVAAILAAVEVVFWVQAVVMVAVSAVLLVLSKTVFIKFFPKKEYRTNYDALIGKEIFITERVEKDVCGAGKYRDVVWTVLSDDTIEVGERAVIKEIRGNKLVVSKE